MKKRILAFALTLAMVVTSLSMLSFVSFAEDAPAAQADFEATDGNLYAWLYSLNVDAGVDRDDPLMMATIPLINEGARNLYMTTAWDYNNVYLHMYYTGLGDPVTDWYLDDVSWTVGGANATASTIYTGVKHSGTYTKISANYYCCEMAIPLSAVNAKLEDGVLSADMTLDIVYSANGDSMTKNYNLVFSGNTLVTKMWDANNISPTTHGFTGFGGLSAHTRNSTTDQGNGTSGSTEPKVGFAGMTGGGANAAYFRFWDMSAYVENNNQNLAIFASLGVDGRDWVNPTIGDNEGNRLEVVVNVENLMPQTITSNTNRSGAGFGADTCLFQIKSGAIRRGYGAPAGARVGICTTIVNGEEHVMLLLATADATSVSCDLTATYGITEDMNFHLAMEEYSDGTTAVFVNGHKALTGAIVSNGWVGAGAIVTVLKRVGNIDANSDATVTADEYLGVNLTRFAMSKINEVDVDTVKGLFATVNGVATAATASTVLTANNGAAVTLANYKDFAASPISLGSASKAWATYDFDAEMLYLILDNRNVDKFDIYVGGAAAEITFTRVSDKFCSPATTERAINVRQAVCTSSDNITAATHALYNGVSGTASTTEDRGWHRTLVSIPLSEVVITKTAGGVAVADISIKATVTETLTGRKTGSYVGSFDGVVTFDIVVPEQEVVMTETGFGTDFTFNQTAGVAGGGTYLNFMNTKAASGGLGAATERTAKFKVTVNTMEAYDVNTLTWGSHWNANLEGQQNICFTMYANKLEYSGSIYVKIFNTTNGGTNGQASLVLAYYERGVGMKLYPLDTTVGNAVDVELVLGYPTYGSIKANGKTLVEKDDIRSETSGTAITTSNQGGVYTMGFAGTKAYEAYNVSVTNMTLSSKTPRVESDFTADDIVALGTTTNVESTGSIKLSYVQETTPVTSSGNALTGPASGNGGAVSADKTTMTVKNTASRAYAQGTFNGLKPYGNRNINFTLNVAALNAYDFSNGGALTGDAKYTEHVNASHGLNTGIGHAKDITAEAFEKLLVGAVAVDSADGLNTAAVAFWVVNDTTDGLVIVHTSYNGVETVIDIAENVGDTINVSIDWKLDSTGSIKVGNADAVNFADIVTVRADHHVTTSNQCYFAGDASLQGYFGLNATWNTDTTDAVPEASLTLTNVTVEMPLDVRFVATIDTTKAKEAGFEINIKGNSNVKKMTTTTVYEAITANYGRDHVSAPDGKYFLALDLQNVPTNNTYTFVVKPFFTYAGETTYGTAYEVTYTNGVYSGYAVAN